MDGPVEEEGVEESEEYLRIQQVESPTPAQKQRHELENHAVFRPWCPICIAGRGLGSQHRRKRQDKAEEAREGATIYSDFFFMNTEEGSQPMLVLKFSRSGRLAATSLPAKGLTDFGVKFFANFIKSTGVRRFVNMSDNEPGMVSLKEAAARCCEGVEAVSRSAPVGDHKGNGHAESAVRQIKGMMRTVRFALEAKLGQKLSNDSCLLQWVPQFSGDLMYKLRKTSNGKTPYEMDLNRKWDRPMMEFGERFFLREAQEVQGRPKRDWESRMVEARYIGHHARSNAVMGLTSSGVKFGYAVSRLPEKDRWLCDGLGELKGAPWDIQPEFSRAPRTPSVVPRVAVLKPEEQSTRSFYVQRKDVEKHGYTQMCPGCVALQKGAARSTAHSAACRDRIVKLVEEEDEDRILRFFERVKDREEERRRVASQLPVRVHEEEKQSGDQVVGVRMSEEVEAERLLEPSSSAAPARGRGVVRAGDGGRAESGSPEKKTRLSPQSRKRKASKEAEGEEERVERGEASVPMTGVGRQTTGSGGSHPVAGSPSLGPATVEDACFDRTQDPSAGDISSLSFDVNGVEVAAELSKLKAEWVEMEKIHIAQCFSKHEVEITDGELEKVAIMAVELGSSHVVELFSPKRVTAHASKLGLRPGFAVDLCEEKPYGPNAGEKWDLSKPTDLQELEDMIDFEKPSLLTGSPPCDPFSLLQNIGSKFCNAERKQRRLQEGLQYLHTAIHFYRKQYDSNRYFLHEHPLGCSSWDDSQMQQLQQLPGVYTVTSPMCHWGMRIGSRRGKEELLAKKPTKWVTNSRFLAKALDQWCANQLGHGLVHKHVELVGGIAHFASEYPLGLIQAIVHSLRQQLLEDGSLSELDLKVGGPVPSESIYSQFGEEQLQEAIEYYDDVTGKQLPQDLVDAGKQEELRWVRSIGLYDKVPRSEVVNKRAAVIPVRWVYVNKGDELNYNVRCRLVGKELKAKTKEALLAHELFSATPPWELIKVLFSLLVSDGPHQRGEELEIGVYDISRAHFMPRAVRELYIELPDIDQEPGADMVGKLNRTMYGCRDASHEWMRDWQELLQQEGYKVGKANPALFFNESANARGAVHGDDFIVLGPKLALDAMNALLKSRYSVRESHRLGFGPGCSKEATILNRVISLGQDGSNRKWVQFEADQRHVDLVLQAAGITKESNAVNTPAVRPTDLQTVQLQSSPLLCSTDATMFRSAVMRASFFVARPP